ncbi:hypothetical protein RRG08_032268 [Elysia crispata]|uniref:Integrase catalytic domain-containing protein n=1 Tax=Elysia crispata TaxID=231223 RepID=A0AAE1E3M0_9GAST|nr:hypothetical protein RRG08_032268 [Elysia crispata]
MSKFCKARPVPYALVNKVGQELDNLEKQGILSKVQHSEWATPVVPVLKQSGDVRLCGDFKITLNPVLQAEQYTLPRVEDIFANLGSGQKFSKIDLRQAYLQLPLNEESRPLTVINTHKGLYAYNRLVFGITSSPAVWQKTIDTILQGIEGVQVNQDDMIITGENDEKHLQNLGHVLQRLEDNGLKANREKCQFFQDEVIFCGFKIDKEGLHKTQDKVDAILQAPVPENKTQLRSFLGLLNYYHKFLDNIAHIAQPMHELLQNNKPFVWSTDCNNAFLKAKELIASDKVLMRYTPELPLRLACDASPYGIGAVLSHITDSTHITHEERKLYNYICGRHFTLVTDHQPLKYIFSPSTGIPATLAARQQRYAAFLSGFNYTIEYKSSKENANADTFSRLPLSTEVKDDSEMETMYYTEVLEALPVSSANISKASRQDPVLSKAIDFTTTTWPATVSDEVKPYFHKRHELSVHQDCLLWGTRVLVPAKLRPQVLQALHDGHLGIVKMKNMARNYFWWPGLDKDIEHMAKGCSGCMHSQQNPQLSPLHPWIFPDSPWHRVHIDYAGPFMGHMFLIVIDAHSKWAEVVPTDSSTSSKTIDILLTIFARFGLPKQIVSDNAPNFTSDEFKNFVRSNAIKHITSAPYHPATNGIAERFAQIFKNAMKSAKKDCGCLHTKLSKFLLAYRNSQHHTTGESPARLLLGRSTRTRLDCLRPSLLEKVTQSQSDQVRHHSQARARVFNTGDNVLTRDYRAADRWAHGTITARNGPLSYSIQTSPGIVWRRHADQIVHTQPGATDPDLILPISLPKDTTRSQSAEPNPVTVPPPAPTVTSTSASPSNLGTQPRRSGRITKPPVKFNL